MSTEAPKTWLGYPEPEDTASIKRISAKEVADAINNANGSELPFQLLDVRRSDLTVRSLTTCPSSDDLLTLMKLCLT